MQMSEAAKRALINVGTNRQGARVPATPAVRRELLLAGLIGDLDGLTRKGSIKRESVLSAALDAAF